MSHLRFPVKSLYDPVGQYLRQGGFTGDVTITSAIRTFAQDLKTAGVWARLRCLWVYQGTTALQQNLNLRNPRKGNLVGIGGTPTYSPTAGKIWTSSAQTDLIGGFNSLASIVSRSGEGGSMFYWSPDMGVGGNSYEMGEVNTVSGASANFLLAGYNTDKSVGPMGLVATTTQTLILNTPTGNPIGLIAVDASTDSLVSGSPKSTITLYKNGGLIATGYFPPFEFSGNTMGVGSATQAGSSYIHPLRSVQVAGIGASLTATQHSALSTAISTFRTNLGR